MEEKAIICEIQRKLDEIEKSEDVKILHCIESGSRAWGFPSPDSDYDVRFFYIRKPEFYLRLDNPRDVIEWEINDVYDINGWDIRKALILLHKSNPTFFEWNNSPLVYRTSSQWETVKSIADRYFVSESGLYHYCGMAKSNYREYLKGENVKLKKYFYVLRPLLACRWIINRGTPPPMLFSELADAELDSSIRTEINKLLEIKKHTSELGTGKRIDVLNDYIENQLEEINQKISTIKSENSSDWNELNTVFLNLIYNERNF